MDTTRMGQGGCALICACLLMVMAGTVTSAPPDHPLRLAALDQDETAAESVVTDEEVEERGDGLVYRLGASEPYTGTVICKYFTGQIMSETHYLDGKLHGRSVTWYENGRMRMDSSYHDGHRDGAWTKWDEDGHVQFQRHYRDGSRVF